MHLFPLYAHRDTWIPGTINIIIKSPIQSDPAVNCCSEAQSIYFTWKEAIQQLSVKSHLQQIKSYTRKSLAYSLLWLKSEKTPLHLKLTKFRFWPLPTLLSAKNVPGHMKQPTFVKISSPGWHGSHLHRSSCFACYSWLTCSCLEAPTALWG